MFGAISVLKAEETNLNLEANVNYFADSNRGLRTNKDNSLSGYNQRLRLSGSYQSELTQSLIGLELYNENLGDEEFEENDYRRVFAEYARAFERGRFSANARVSQDSSLEDEFLISGPVRINVDRLRLNGGLGYNHFFTETKAVNTNFSIEKVDYDEFIFRLQEYDYYSLSLQPSWYYQENASTYLSVSASLLDYGDKDQNDLPQVLSSNSFLEQSVTRSLGLGWRYQPSERADWNLNLGYRETTYEGVFLSRVGVVNEDNELTGIFVNEQPTEEHGYGFTGSINFSYKRERSSSKVALSQAATPNSSGDLVDQQSLLFAHERKLRNRSYFRTTLKGLRQRSDLNPASDNNINSVIFSSSVNWRFTKDWYVHIRYRYLFREFVADDREADSNLVELGLKWKTDPLYW